MRWTRRSWLQRVGTVTGVGVGVGAGLFLPSGTGTVAAQQGGAPAAGAGRPKPAGFVMPKKNVPLSYGVRRIPWEQRRGAKVWPNGARIAFTAEMALEYWDWNHVRRQSVNSGRAGVGTARPYTYLGKTTLDARTAGEYGGQIGVHRLAEALRELKIPYTIMTCGSFAEDFPEVVKELANMPDVEVMDHSYSYSISTVELTKEEQREYTLKSSRILQQVTGKKPVGQLSQGASCDENTLAVLAEEGYLYNADLQDDELPYLIDISGKTIVEMPWRFSGNINDFPTTGPNPGFTLQGALDHLKLQFDLLYAESALYPKHVLYGTHPPISGHADNMWVFKEYLKHVKSHPDVWMTTFQGAAEWWMKQYSKGYDGVRQA